MIDKVVIFGIRRGNKLISQNELAQSIGRCGRSYTKSGQAIVLTKSDDYEQAQKLLFGKMPPIQSVMDQIQNVCFHVLPMILTQEVKDQQSFYKWFQKTLAFTQGKRVLYKDVVDFLVQQQTIAFFNKNIVINVLGQISSKFYYSPQRIKSLKDRLQDIYQSGDIENTVAISWALSDQRIILGTVDENELGEYKRKCSQLGYVFDHGQLIHGYCYYCLLNGLRPKWLKYVISNEYNDFDRLCNALLKIAQYLKYEINKEIEMIQLCAKKRVTLQTAKIMIDLNIKSKKNILQLIQFGVTSKEDLQVYRDKIRQYGTKQLNEQLDNRGK